MARLVWANAGVKGLVSQELPPSSRHAFNTTPACSPVMQQQCRCCTTVPHLDDPMPPRLWQEPCGVGHVRPRWHRI